MKGSPGYRFSKDELDWVAANLDTTRGWARGDRIITWTLLVTFLVGLVVYLVGFAMGTGVLAPPDGWPTELLADLFVNLGVALWTSVILVLFLEVVPRWQQRQAQAWAGAALVALRERGDAVPETPAPGGSPEAISAKLDEVLARLNAIESAVGRADGSPE